MALEKNAVVDNQVLEAIRTRRSCRDYEQKPIPKQILTKIIEAGNQAPFVADLGAQPWRFVIVENPDFRQKLVQAAYPIWKSSMDSMKDAIPEIYDAAMNLYDSLPDPKDLVYYSAPAIVFVLGPKSKVVDCSLACENIMIAATSFGLGSCYVGFGAMVTDNPEVVQTLELTDDERIYGPILLGYPKDESDSIVAKGLALIAPLKKEPEIRWI